jgi:hypothetical protein
MPPLLCALSRIADHCAYLLPGLQSHRVQAEVVRVLQEAVRRVCKRLARSDCHRLRDCHVMARRLFRPAQPRPNPPPPAPVTRLHSIMNAL